MTKTIPLIKKQDLTYVSALGVGTFGKVDLYKFRTVVASDRYVVVKQLLKCHMTNDDLRHLKREATLLWDLKFDRIVNVFGMICSDNELCIVTEYVKYGSCFCFFQKLKAFLTTKENRLKTWALKCRIAMQVVEGMVFLNGQKPKNVLHLNLKSTNVLLDRDLCVKICDFGLFQMHTLAKLTRVMSNHVKYENVSETKRQVEETISHIAPEHLLDPNRSATEKSDTYSFGIFLWELLSNGIPYHNALSLNVLRALREPTKYNRPELNEIPEDAPKFLQEAMQKSWKQVPEQRPSFVELQETLEPNFEKHSHKVKAAVVCLQHAHSLSDTPTTVNSDVVGNHQSVSPTCLADKSPHSARYVNQCVRNPETKHASKETVCAELKVSPTGSEIVGNSKALGYKRPRTKAFGGYKKRTIRHESVDHATDKFEIGNQKGIWWSNGYSRKCWIAFSVALLLFASTCVLCVMAIHSGTTNVNEETEKTLLFNHSSHNGDSTFSPMCQKQPIPSGIDEILCTNHHLQGSICTYRCTGGKKAQGLTERTCLVNGEWSSPYPACKCPECHFGESCENELTFKNLRKQLEKLKISKFKKPMQLTYGDRIITCEAEFVLPWYFNCACHDSRSNWKAKCLHYFTPRKSCRNAASQLLRHHASSGLYEYPCDRERMPIIC